MLAHLGNAYTREAGIGFATRYTEPNGSMPGWKSAGSHSWAYHSDDGELYEYTRIESDATGGPTWHQGDTVGCGIDFAEGTIFFTKNGELIGKYDSSIPAAASPFSAQRMHANNHCVFSQGTHSTACSGDCSPVRALVRMR